jgi:hypothetical protein
MHRGHILIGLDRLADAGTSLITGRKMSEELGIRWPLLTYQVLLALNHFLAGEWDDAVAELEAGIGMADEAGETYLLPLGYDIMALIRLHRNDMAGARQAAAAAEAQLAGTGPTNRMYGAMWAPALLLEASGDIAGALATVAGLWDQCVRSGAVVECPVLGADLVRLAIAAGDTARAAEVAAVVAEVVAAGDVPSLTGAPCTAWASPTMTPGCSPTRWSLTRADRVRSSSPWPLRTRAGPWSGWAGSTAPAACSTGLLASTRASRQPATWPAPRRPCASWVSGAASAGRAGGRRPDGRA